MNSPTPATAPQVDMDEILSSIRSGVEEETAKAVAPGAEPRDDLLEAAAAEAEALVVEAPVAETPAPTNPVPADDGDVLELSAEELVPEATPEDVIDLAEFAKSGETTMVAPAATSAADLAAELLGEAAPASTPAAPAAEDDFDRLLAEISTEKEQKTAEVAVKQQELLAEEEPLGDVSSLLENGDVALEETPEAGTEAVPAADEPLAPVAALDMPTLDNASVMTLGMVDGENGPQVAFPAEVLAMVLRPMVQQWLNQNLPTVVERLVKDEIAKLAQN